MSVAKEAVMSSLLFKCRVYPDMVVSTLLGLDVITIPVNECCIFSPYELWAIRPFCAIKCAILRIPILFGLTPCCITDRCFAVFTVVTEPGAPILSGKFFFWIKPLEVISVH